MSKYHANELLNSNKNDIRHWKYIKKIPVGKGYRYFYTWDEYRAYLADPTAELQKVGNKVQNEINATKQNTISKVSTGRKKTSKILSKDKLSLSVAGVKQANSSRSPSIKQRLNDLAKEASKKWEDSKESIKESIEKGKEWLKNLFSKPDKPDKQNKKKEQATNPYEKYKYTKKLKINGKTRYFYSDEEYDAYLKRSEYMKNEPDFMKGFKHSEDPYTRYEDAALVNPKFDRYDNNDDYEYNCAECTMIYELRRRGYDVESNGVSGALDGTNDNTGKRGILQKIREFGEAEAYNSGLRFKLCFEGADTKTVQRTKSDEDTYKAIYKEIDKNPPGSRGDLSVSWKGQTSGHSMVWEKDRNGKIRIIDSQVSGGNGYVEYNLKELSHEIDNDSVVPAFRASVTRTDNLKLKKGVTKICKNSNQSVKKFMRSSDMFIVDKHSAHTMNEKERVTYYPVLLEEENRNGKKH